MARFSLLILRLGGSLVVDMRRFQLSHPFCTLGDVRFFLLMGCYHYLLQGEKGFRRPLDSLRKMACVRRWVTLIPR